MNHHISRKDFLGMLSMGLVQCVLVGSVFAAPAAHAQVGIVRQGIESIGRAGAKLFGKRSLTHGLTQAGVEVVEAAAKKYGDDVAERAAHYCRTHGAVAERALRADAKTVVRALDRLPEDEARRALQVIDGDVADMTRFIQQNGTPSLQFAVKHPRLGREAVETYGREIATVAHPFTSRDLRILADAAPAYKQLEPMQKRGFLDALKKAPVAVLDELEKHPKTTKRLIKVTALTAAGTTSYLASRDHIWGPVPEDPSQAPLSPGRSVADKVGYGIIGFLTLCGAAVILRAWRRPAQAPPAVAQVNAAPKAPEPDEARP